MAVREQPTETSVRGEGHARGDEGTVGQPMRLLRLAAMAEDLLAEVRQLELDATGSERLQRIFRLIVAELREVLTEDLQQEMDSFLIIPSSNHPDELRVAQAQLTGWLEGVVRCVAAHQQAEALETFIRTAVENARSHARERERVEERPPGQYL